MVHGERRESELILAPTYGKVVRFNHVTDDSVQQRNALRDRRGEVTMRWVRAYVSRQLEEISADPALRAYGVALVALHVLTAFWLRHNDIAAMVATGQEAICWPLLPECERLRVLSGPALSATFKLYGAVALLVAVGFARRRWIAGGYWGLVLLTVFKLAVIALDFRLRPTPS